MKNFCLLLFLVLALGITVQAQEPEALPYDFDAILEQIREEVFSPQIGPMMYTPQIFIDTQDIPHTPPKHLHELLIPAADDYVIEPFFTPSPYSPGATRVMSWGGNQATATLRMQGSRVNIWTVGTSLPVTTAMRNRFDQIVNAMETSFAPFAGVRVTTPYSNMPLIGDIHGDGRVNVFLHNHTGGGFFSNGDYFTNTPGRPIPMFHVSSNFANPAHPHHSMDTLYNIFAHELQHLLFHLHIAVYMTRVVDDSFLWFNEALSELAGFLYANPGSETIDVGRNFDAAINSYADSMFFPPTYGDFLNFNNSLKNYGMSMMYGIHLRRNQSNAARRLFDFFRANMSPSQNMAQFSANRNWVQGTSMQVKIGNALQFAGLTGTTGAGGATAFSANYFIFMENFAADGGSVDGRQTARFMNSNFAAHRLWGIRPNLGTFGRLYYSATGGWYTVPPPRYPAFPTITATNRNVSLSGFNGTPPGGGGASHESFHLLGGRVVVANTRLNISISDNNSSTRYYVVIPNTHLHGTATAGNRTFGQHGATVHRIIANGTPHIIDTYGRDAYLFVATLFRNVNATVNHSWQAPVPPRTISFNANGGTGTMAAQTIPSGNNFTIPANAFTRANFNFTGWNTAANGTGQSFAPGATITNVTANITLFAQWTPVTRTVSFMANGGTGTMSAITVNHGISVTIPPLAFTRLAHTFDGWATQAGGGGTRFAPGATIPSVTANMTLFAQWIPYRWVMFDRNGGSGHMLAISQPNGTDFALPGWDAITLTRRNHGFTGWNTARDGSGQSFAPGDTIHNVTAHMTLFAQWGVSVLVEEPAPTWGRPARVRIPYRGVAEFELAVRGLPNREFDLECPQTPNYIEFTWPSDMPMEIVPTGILVPQGDGVHLGIVTIRVQR